jgi:hypothetical protein
VGGNPHYFPLSFDLIYSVFVVIFKQMSAIQVWGSVLLRYGQLESPIRYCISGHIGDNVSFKFGGITFLFVIFVVLLLLHLCKKKMLCC